MEALVGHDPTNIKVLTEKRMIIWRIPDVKAYLNWLFYLTLHIWLYAKIKSYNIQHRESYNASSTYVSAASASILESRKQQTQFIVHAATVLQNLSSIYVNIFEFIKNAWLILVDIIEQMKNKLTTKLWLKQMRNLHARKNAIQACILTPNKILKIGQ